MYPDVGDVNSLFMAPRGFVIRCGWLGGIGIGSDRTAILWICLLSADADFGGHEKKLINSGGISSAFFFFACWNSLMTWSWFISVWHFDVSISFEFEWMSAIFFSPLTGKYWTFVDFCLFNISVLNGQHPSAFISVQRHLLTCLTLSEILLECRDEWNLILCCKKWQQCTCVTCRTVQGADSFFFSGKCWRPFDLGESPVSLNRRPPFTFFFEKCLSRSSVFELRRRSFFFFFWRRIGKNGGRWVCLLSPLDRRL